jgi:hypothetical protein
MKPQELRLGNWVNSRIGEIEVNITQLEEMVSLGCEAIGYEPIPLTEEWFVKNCDLDMGWLNVWKAKIEYVHQLQNLYYALTGEELKVAQLEK